MMLDVDIFECESLANEPGTKVSMLTRFRKDEKPYPAGVCQHFKIEIRSQGDL